MIVASSPLAYFLQTVPPIPALPAHNETEVVNESLDEEKKCGSSSTTVGSSNYENQKSIDQEMTAKEEFDCRPLEDIAAPDIKTALIEALTSPIFICVTLGFSSCGFHIAFLSTHLPAYLVSREKKKSKKKILTLILFIGRTWYFYLLGW